MTRVFLATLGQRPAAITVALDKLMEHYDYVRVAILHTEPRHSGIAKSLMELRPVLERDYPQCEVVFHELQFHNGKPLIDIKNQQMAEAYYRALLLCFQQYIRERYTLHLMVAGGRKAMSIYATIAASLLFRPQDRVWTVLSPPHLITRQKNEGTFHAREVEKLDVQLVRLPILDSDMSRETVAAMGVDEFVATQNNPHRLFLSGLTEEEKRLVNKLADHPDATNERLASWLYKAESTIENQFTSIYKQMEQYFTVTQTHKKAFLIEILKQINGSEM